MTAVGNRAGKRVDIISDTHGYLSPSLLQHLEGADLIIHAGDITSETDFEHLCTIAPVQAVLGNNDYYRDYGPSVRELNLFEYEGLRFAVAHYREELPVGPWTLPCAGTRIAPRSSTSAAAR